MVKNGGDDVVRAAARKDRQAGRGSKRTGGAPVPSQLSGGHPFLNGSMSRNLLVLVSSAGQARVHECSSRGTLVAPGCMTPWKMLRVWAFNWISLPASINGTGQL